MQPKINIPETIDMTMAMIISTSFFLLASAIASGHATSAQNKSFRFKILVLVLFGCSILTSRATMVQMEPQEGSNKYPILHHYIYDHLSEEYDCTNHGM